MPNFFIGVSYQAFYCGSFDVKKTKFWPWNLPLEFLNRYLFIWPTFWVEKKVLGFQFWARQLIGRLVSCSKLCYKAVTSTSVIYGSYHNFLCHRRGLKNTDGEVGRYACEVSQAVWAMWAAPKHHGGTISFSATGVAQKTKMAKLEDTRVRFHKR